MPPSNGPTWAQFFDAFELFRDPLLCALVAGGVLGYLSVYVVLRRMVFVSAAVSQSAALGVALAFYAHIHMGAHIEPVAGAAGLALLTTLLLMVDPSRLRLPRESVLGVAWALSGGLAVLIGDRISQEAHDIQSILFGTAVMVRTEDLWLVVAVGVVTLLLHLWWFRGLAFAAFDPVSARVQGLPVPFLDGVLLVSIGLMVGVSARALGALPVFAFSTLSAVAALLLDIPLPLTFALAALLGALAGVGGYLFAFFYEFPVGGSQTTLAGVFVGAALVVRLVVQVLRRRAG